MSVYIRIVENMKKAGLVVAFIVAACGSQAVQNPVRSVLTSGGHAASLGCPGKPRICLTGMTQDDANALAQMAEGHMCPDAGATAIQDVTLSNVDDLCPLPGVQGGPGI
jgi:hypothetical protein